MRSISFKDFGRLIVLAIGLGFFLTGCGASGGPRVTEYALVEQSTDNPTHAAFAERVPQAVMERQAVWGAGGQSLDLPNQMLTSFGFRLAANPTPPFSGYALYAGDTLVQRDIARFWPVSVAQSRGDFLLAYETLTGERLLASTAGVQPWGGAQSIVPPVYYRDEIAYAQTGVDSSVAVVTGSELLYSGIAAAAPRNLHTWGSASEHWALELDGQVILDGQNLNEQRGYEDVFGWQILHDQPFYFYTNQGITHLSYAGRDLAYRYDAVLHDQPAELAIFNPGASQQMVWFYALRDGLWYYVEVTFEA